MIPNELKTQRKEMELRQKDLAELKPDMSGGGRFQNIFLGCKYHFDQMN
jgi:hypothetical protein